MQCIIPIYTVSTSVYTWSSNGRSILPGVSTSVYTVSTNLQPAQAQVVRLRTRTRTPSTSSDGSEHIPTASLESMGGSYSHHTPNLRIIRTTSKGNSPLLKAIEMGLREHAPPEGAG
jgi:hypothetical protein